MNVTPPPPARTTPILVFLDLDVPTHQLAAALNGTGLKIKANRDGLVIVQAYKEKRG